MQKIRIETESVKFDGQSERSPQFSPSVTHTEVRSLVGAGASLAGAVVSGQGVQSGRGSTIHIARAHAAERLSDSCPSMRSMEKIDLVANWLGQFRVSSGGVIKEVLEIKRNGYAKQLCERDVLECVKLKGGPVPCVYGLSRNTALLYGRQYSSPTKHLGNLSHRLAVQSEALCALRSYPTQDLNETRMLVEPILENGMKRPDILFVGQDGSEVALEVELSRKNTADMQRLISYAGGIGRKGDLLITCGNMQVVSHVLLHLFNAMERGRVPVLKRGERPGDPDSVAFEKPVNPWQAFGGVYIKLLGRPWSLSRGQSLVCLLQGRTEE